MKFNTPKGDKKYRYADAVERVDGEIVSIYQVGKVSKNGLPVSRESKAIADIMDSSDYNGAPVNFLPYNSEQGTITYMP